MSINIDAILHEGRKGTPPGLHLTLGELLLIVHSLSASTRFLPDIEWGALMRWQRLREQVWEAICALPMSRPGEIDIKARELLPLTTIEAQELLAILPITHRWGVGEDVGFSLCMYLYQYAAGVYLYKAKEESNGDQNAATDATPSPAEGQSPI